MTDKKETKEVKEIQLGESQVAAKVLIKPWITESSTKGLEMNKYVFVVSKEATKEQVKKAISELYKVKVLTVNTVTIPRKKRNYGKTPGWITGFKKAIVTLKAGDSIELIKSV